MPKSNTAAVKKNVETINLPQLIDETAERTGVSKKDTEKVILGLFDVTVDHLENNEHVRYSKIVSFDIYDVPERIHKNPKTDEPVVKSAHTEVRTNTLTRINEIGE